MVEYDSEWIFAIETNLFGILVLQDYKSEVCQQSLATPIPPPVLILNDMYTIFAFGVLCG